MGASVAFQAPVTMQVRPAPPPPRSTTGTPSKPPTSIFSVPGFPGVPIFQVPRTIIQGIVKQSGLPTRIRPASLPPTPYDPTSPYPPPPQPTFLPSGGNVPSITGVLTAPVQGPGISDTGGAPPLPPSIAAGGGGGGDGSGGGGAGGVTVSGSAQIPWLTLALIAGGLYLVTR
jgi:hypothetical protein